MEAFTYDQLASRTVFGPGRRRHLAAEVDRLGATSVFLIADGAATVAADELADGLADRRVVRWSKVAQHVPIELAEEARAAVDGAAEDGPPTDTIVCVGGGSATGLAKAIALSHRLPIVAVPTTYAGSEQTTIYGLTGDRHKETGKDPAVQPVTVIYDAELTVGLPADVTGPSAFNALAHGVEALYTKGHNPVTSVLALEGARAIHDSLATVMQRPADVDARGELLYGAFLSGMALGATDAGLHHKLAHVLGGTFGLVHADTHSVLLPHVVAFNAPALPAEMSRLSAVLGADDGDAAGALWDLARASGVPTSLADLGLTGDALAEAARRATAELPVNPRPVAGDDVLALLHRAYHGARPS